MTTLTYPQNSWPLFVTCIAINAYQLWQILFRDKIGRPFQDWVHRKYPPEGFEYRKLTDVPYRKIKSRDSEGRPTTSKERYPVIYLEDRGPIHAITLPYDTSNPEPGPVISQEGRWVVVQDGGSKFGEATVCSDCAPFWFVLGFTALGFVWLPALVWFAFIVGFPRTIMAFYNKIRSI